MMMVMKRRSRKRRRRKRRGGVGLGVRERNGGYCAMLISVSRVLWGGGGFLLAIPSASNLLFKMI